jgi:hypothetical protein
MFRHYVFAGLIAVFLATPSRSAPAATGNVLTLHQQGSRIELTSASGRVKASRPGGGPSVRVDRQLASLLLRVAAAHELLESRDGSTYYFVVHTREMSRPLALGRGQCGSGEEQLLVLLALDAGGLRIADQLLLASCFQSIELAGDGDDVDGVPAVVQVDDNDDTIRFAWLNDGKDTQRVLSIAAGRFSLELRPASAPRN